MRKIVSILILIFCASISCFAQAKPFADFDKAVREEKGGFSENKENLSKVFNQERMRLGENFESELWKYIGDDVEKIYWLNSFVESESYLHGNKPLPDLAFKIRQKGLESLSNKNDKKNLGRKVTLNRKQAIYYYKNGNRDLALKTKAETENLLKENEISAYVGGMTRLDNCVYLNLEGDASFCEAESKKPIETIVSSGIVNGIAVKLPQPENPQNLKGEVYIKVLISENGEVISADALKGVKELFDASVKVARLAKFPTFTLSDKPTKRSGVIIYKFPQ